MISTILSLAASLVLTTHGAPGSDMQRPTPMMQRASLRALTSLPATPATQYVAILTDHSGSFNSTRFSLIGFNYEVISSRDPATGMATGRRMHKPIVFVQEVNSMSPAFFQDLVNNVMFPIVEIQMLGPDAAGKIGIIQNIKLTIASMVDYRQFVEKDAGPLKGHLMEEVSFAFHKIEMTNVPGNRMASDALGGSS